MRINPFSPFLLIQCWFSVSFRTAHWIGARWKGSLLGSVPFHSPSLCSLWFCMPLVLNSSQLMCPQNLFYFSHSFTSATWVCVLFTCFFCTLSNFLISVISSGDLGLCNFIHWQKPAGRSIGHLGDEKWIFYLSTVDLRSWAPSQTRWPESIRILVVFVDYATSSPLSLNPRE